VALAHALHFSADPRRHELAREAVAVARRVADPTCLAQVLGSACFALWQLGNLAERVEMAAEMGRLAEREADAVLKFHAGLALCLCATQQGDLDRARAVLGNVTALAEELGRPALRLQALRVAGAHAMLDGRFADLERLATEALRIAEALGTQEGRRNYHAQMGGRCLVQGDLSDVVEHVNGAAVPVAGMQAALAWALAEAGQVDEARAIVAAEGSSFGDIPANYLQETTLVGLAAAAVALGDVDLARWLYPELLPYRAQIHTGFSASFGPIAHHLGRLAALLGFLDEADDHFAFAAALQERTGARGWLPQTRLEWARLLLRRARPGDGEMAHTQAGAAVELADDLGAPALAARGRQLLDTASTAIPRR
jgi:tetratricopeptide (TPR) repeat protein